MEELLEFVTLWEEVNSVHRVEDSEDEIKWRWTCRAYSPSTHARKEEDGLLIEFPYNPIRTRSV
jgi:hypothetical protein